MRAWPPQALVLTAGLGTRLRPLTSYRAKPAMPVGADALACHILRQLSGAGIEEAVLNLHHLPATITREVGDGTQYGLRVRYSWEQPQILGSAGGPRHALPLLDGDTLLVVNGDTLCDIPIEALWERHVASGALVTLGLMPHPEPGRYGGVTLDMHGKPGSAAFTAGSAPDAASAARALGGSAALAGGRLLGEGTVTGFVPRTSPVASVHYPGIQIVQRAVFETLPDDTPAESVGQVYPSLMASRPGSVRGVVFAAHFEDVGTVDDYRRACRSLGVRDARGNVVDGTARISPSATLRNSIVWPHACVPDGCDLDDVIVTGHVSLAPGTRLRSALA